MPKLAKWYRKDIPPSSVSDKIKTSGYTKPKGRRVIATCALGSMSRDLPNIITAVNSVRDSAVSFGVAVNRNW